MSVRKIKKSWWVDFRFKGSRNRLRSPENSKTGAEAYEASLRQKLARGESLSVIAEKEKPKPKLFWEFAEEWMRTYVKTNNTPKEQIRKESALRVHLYPFFGAIPLEEITGYQIEQFKVSLLQARLAANTVNNILLVLSRCLKCAKEWGVIEATPSLKLVKAPPTKFDHLSPEELRELLFACEGSKWFGMILLASKTGMRFGEIIALEWPDVDFERRQITVQRSVSHRTISAPKNNRKRFIPMTNELLDELAPRKKAHGFLFPSIDGGLLTHSMARKALEKYCERAGIRRIGWHTLRHSFASQLVSAGVSIRIVQEMLGHADTKTTLRYAHLAPSSLHDAIQVLSGAEKSEIHGFGQQVGNRTRTLGLDQERALKAKS